jgi:hypothetical protein
VALRLLRRVCFCREIGNLSYRVVQRLSSGQRAARCGFPRVMCGVASNVPAHRLGLVSSFGLDQEPDYGG